MTRVKKYYLVVAVVFSILLCFNSVLADTENTSEEVMFVNTSAGAVFENPSEEGEAIATLFGNTEIVKLSSQGEWSFIRFGGGQYGYILSAQLSTQQHNTEGRERVLAADSVILYGEPVLTSSMVLILPNGTHVEDRGVFFDTSFHVIVYQDTVWYLNNADSVLMEIGSQGVDTRYINGFRVNIRASASSSSDVVCKLFGNTPVEIVSQTGNWSQIRFRDNQIGYIGNSYLSLTPQNNEGVEKYVSSGSAVLYAEPVSGCEDRKELPYGTFVEDRGAFFGTSYNVIIHNEDVWYLYNAESKLSLTDDLVEETRYVTDSPQINIREKANASSEVVGTIYGNTEVSVLKVEGEWSLIRFGDNQRKTKVVWRNR